MGSAPTGTDTTIVVNEDGSHGFTAADFGFSDADGDALSAIIISTLPVTGTLTLGGAVVSAGDEIPAASLGQLVFTPARNGNGISYASFTFQVRDDGGVQGGDDTDSTPNTITFDVNAVNDAPAPVNIQGNASKYFNNSPPVFIDVAQNAAVTDVDSPNFAGGYLSLTITENAHAAEDMLGVAEGGGITLSGNTVLFNGLAFATASGLGTTALNFAFNDEATPAIVGELIQRLTYSNADPSSPTPGVRGLTLEIVDGDGTANGGDDSVSRHLTVRVSVNDPPSGADRTATIAEDSTYSFAASDFSFSDVDGNGLLSVIIASLPTAGTLTLDGVAVIAGQAVPLASIEDLVFTPRLNGNGTGYASFAFQLRDNGGEDTDQTPDTITINVTAVDDMPVAVADGPSVDADTVTAIAVVANDTDVDGGPKNVVEINGSAVSAGVPVTLASGATVTLNADGTIAYDPNGRFDWLVSPATAAATGASNGAATDGFDYSLNGGSGTTVTVTVRGVDEPGDELLGTPEIDTITGTAGDDVVRAFQSDDALAGGNGDDAVYGNDGADTLTGNAGNDRLFGGNGDDLLTGGDGDDVLVSGRGDDTMRGGDGGDLYYVDSVGDTVIETLDAGVDTVRATLDYVLSSGCSSAAARSAAPATRSTTRYSARAAATRSRVSQATTSSAAATAATRSMAGPGPT